MKSRLPLTVLATALLLPIAGTAEAAVLYGIPTFTDGTGPNAAGGGFRYYPEFVVINIAPGVAGTSALQLFQLQTINANAMTSTTGARFQNNRGLDGSHSATTLITDTGGYFQFGIVADVPNTLFLDSLTFNATQATGTLGTRGYSVQVSVDGSSYNPLGAANLTTVRGSSTAVNLPLEGLQYDGATSINFRVTSTGGGVEYTNFAINGTVIPEPSAALLALLGCIALSGVRRR